MKYYIIAGERSGDLHGGNLIRAIKSHDHSAHFRGFGGDYMKEVGADIIVHYNEMAFMGFLEVAKNFRTISRYIKKCKQDILQYNPDVIILIDYAGFNQRMSRFGKDNGIKVFYYITPKVWAWWQRRALQLKATVDRMFVILPFEKDFFRKYDCEVDYVGNPVLDAVKSHKADPDFLTKNNFSTGKPLVAILPGSRKQELQNMAPVLAEAIKKFPEYQFAVAGINNLDKNLYAPFTGRANVKLVFEDTYNLLLNSNAAIVTSGTATLETGLFKVPQVVVYRTSPISYRIAKSFISVGFISLINLIAGREVIKELIQIHANADKIGNELQRLLQDQDYRLKIMKDYDEIYKKLDIGSASENTGRLMVKYLTEKSTRL
jgi:lipid-A-disaccharide synthase